MSWIILIVLAFLAISLYLLPASIAYRHGSKDAGIILFLNIFLGWTGIFWLALLFWGLQTRED